MSLNIKLLINKTEYTDQEIIDGVSLHSERAKALDEMYDLLFEFNPNGYVFVITNELLILPDDNLELSERWTYMDLSKSLQVSEETTKSFNVGNKEGFAILTVYYVEDYEE